MRINVIMDILNFYILMSYSYGIIILMNGNIK